MTIPKFTSELITKEKLNVLVGGINTNAEDITNIESTLADRVILTSNITKTVGVGGDFARISSAIDWCKKVVSNGFMVTILLLSGTSFEDDGIEVFNQDLSFVTVNSEGTGIITINRTAQNAPYSSFVYGINSKMPKIQVGGVKYTGFKGSNGVVLDNSECTLGDIFKKIEFVIAGIFIFNNSNLYLDAVHIKDFTFLGVRCENSKLVASNIASGISCESSVADPSYGSDPRVFVITNSDVQALLSKPYGYIIRGTLPYANDYKLFSIENSNVMAIDFDRFSMNNWANIIDITNSVVGYKGIKGLSSGFIPIKVTKCSNFFRWDAESAVSNYINYANISIEKMSRSHIGDFSNGNLAVFLGGQVRVDTISNVSLTQTKNTITHHGIIFTP